MIVKKKTATKKAGRTPEKTKGRAITSAILLELGFQRIDHDDPDDPNPGHYYELVIAGTCFMADLPHGARRKGAENLDDRYEIEIVGKYNGRRFATVKTADDLRGFLALRHTLVDGW